MQDRDNDYSSVCINFKSLISKDFCDNFFQNVPRRKRTIDRFINIFKFIDHFFFLQGTYSDKLLH